MRILKIKKLKSVKEQSWMDIDYIMFHSCFQLLCDFVEREDPFEIIDWDYEEVTKKVKDELIELYNWYKNEWDEEKYDDIWENECQNNLERLVKIRRYMWT